MKLKSFVKVLKKEEKPIKNFMIYLTNHFLMRKLTLGNILLVNNSLRSVMVARKHSPILNIKLHWPLSSPISSNRRKFTITQIPIGTRKPQ